jgi:hypothetical protein
MKRYITPFLLTRLLMEAEILATQTVYIPRKNQLGFRIFKFYLN